MTARWRTRNTGHEGRNATTRIDQGHVPLDLLLRTPGGSGEEKLFTAEHPNGRYSDPNYAFMGKTPAAWEALKASLRAGPRKGWEGVLVEVRNGKATINEGNHRVRAAHQAGLKSLPTKVIYYGEVQPHHVFYTPTKGHADAPRETQRGKRGGMYYLGSNGQKVYVGGASR